MNESTLADRLALAREAIVTNIRANKAWLDRTSGDPWSDGVIAGLEIALKFIDAAAQKKP